ncbi:M20/M25/M40 family metallo-hydrolase, partial [Candidatus Bathyarchaeota archaeon]|nr:M20/M25/M40 family metallo-hydrolase [Candidatus Bathyarchaeota archaeon]
MKKDPVEFLKHMLEIYSPSGKEEKLSSFLAEELRTLGFEEVWKDEAGNVYGAVGKGSPIVLMCGHMDTVPGEIPVKVKNGRLYGRGAVDAKSSLAAMILAAANLKNSLLKIGGRIIVAGVVDEEGGGRGIKQLIREGLKVDYAFFGEPSGIGNITFA